MPTRIRILALSPRGERDADRRISQVEGTARDHGEEKQAQAFKKEEAEGGGRAEAVDVVAGLGLARLD